jgi:uncharacterized protein
MRAVSVLISGLLFGAGVTISGMVNPMKVLNFLDLFGAFDPTLIFVMGAGLGVTAVGYHFIFRHAKPLFDDVFMLPESNIIDAKLLGGAALFGVGWGLTGLCPAPAVAGLVFFQSESVIFVVALSIGMIATKMFTARSVS